MVDLTRNFPKLERHPDFEEIDQLIREDKPVMSIVQMLDKRYPADSRLQMKHEYLYTYRKHRYPELREISRHRGVERRLGRMYGDTKSRLTPGDSGDDNMATRYMKLTGQEPKPPKPKITISDEQLLSWGEGTNGFVKFTEEMIVERGELVKLQDYQIEMSDLIMKNSRVCICGAGQIGKDFMMQNHIIHRAITRAGSLQLIICATQAQSVALMDRIEGKMKASGNLIEIFLRRRMKPEAQLLFVNGSRALFLTAKSTIAGHTDVDTIWVNEARDIRPEEVSRASPLLGIGGGQLYVMSRPRFRRGYFWDCFNNPRFKHMTIRTEQNKYFDKETLEDERATLSPDLFRIEYLGEFADAGSAYFSETAIDACSKVDYEFKAMVADHEHYEYSIGIDPARLRDTSAMIVVGRHRKTGHLKVFIVHGFSPDTAEPASFESQYAYINLLDSFFRFKYIIPESAGMGGPYTERLDVLMTSVGRPYVVTPYDTNSLSAKIALYAECKRVIENHLIQMPRGAFRLINELKMTQFGATVTGKVKIETPVTDDYADALCLAVWAFKKPFEMGVGVVKRRVRVNPW